MALAIDHRAQLEAIADRVGAPRATHRRVQVAGRRRRGAGRRRPAGLRHAPRRDLWPRGALRRRKRPAFWIGRPVEAPGSRPLRFEFDQDIGGAPRRMAGDPNRQMPRLHASRRRPGAEGRADGQRCARSTTRRGATDSSFCRDHLQPAGPARRADHGRRHREPLRGRASSRTGGSSNRSHRRRRGAAVERRDHGQRSLVPRRRPARPRSAGGGTGSGVRRRFGRHHGQGLCRRPHDLQRGGREAGWPGGSTTRPPSTTWPSASAGWCAPGRVCAAPRRLRE